MMSGTVPVSILGTNFAMAQHPFWKPDQFSTCILSIQQPLFLGGALKQGTPGLGAWAWTRYVFKRLTSGL